MLIRATFLIFVFSLAGHGVTDAFNPDLPSKDRRGVAKVLAKIGPGAEARMRPYFERAGITYPPHSIALVVLKEEMQLELWAEKDENQGWVLLRSYPFLGSGDQGPKRKRGDRQVPEGVYEIVEFNPNSRFHLSMKLNYPNEYDVTKAQNEHRTDLGGDIYIHGKNKSWGCIAVGDRAIEELFVVAARSARSPVKVLIAPRDLRKGEFSPPPKPEWLPELYEALHHELVRFRAVGGS